MKSLIKLKPFFILLFFILSSTVYSNNCNVKILLPDHTAIGVLFFKSKHMATEMSSYPYWHYNGLQYQKGYIKKPYMTVNSPYVIDSIEIVSSSTLSPIKEHPLTPQVQYSKEWVSVEDDVPAQPKRKIYYDVWEPTFSLSNLTSLKSGETYKLILSAASSRNAKQLFAYFKTTEITSCRGFSPIETTPEEKLTVD